MFSGNLALITAVHLCRADAVAVPDAPAPVPGHAHVAAECARREEQLVVRARLMQVLQLGGDAQRGGAGHGRGQRLSGRAASERARGGAPATRARTHLHRAAPSEVVVAHVHRVGRGEVVLPAQHELVQQLPPACARGQAGGRRQADGRGRAYSAGAAGGRGEARVSRKASRGRRARTRSARGPRARSRASPAAHRGRW